jgi:hypothetical protein
VTPAREVATSQKSYSIVQYSGKENVGKGEGEDENTRG